MRGSSTGTNLISAGTEKTGVLSHRGGRLIEMPQTGSTVALRQCLHTEPQESLPISERGSLALETKAETQINLVWEAAESRLHS